MGLTCHFHSKFDVLLEEFVEAFQIWCVTIAYVCEAILETAEYGGTRRDPAAYHLYPEYQAVSDDGGGTWLSR